MLVKHVRLNGFAQGRPGGGGHFAEKCPPCHVSGIREREKVSCEIKRGVNTPPLSGNLVKGVRPVRRRAPSGPALKHRPPPSA
jgi:hypothetical protein